MNDARTLDGVNRCARIAALVAGMLAVCVVLSHELGFAAVVPGYFLGVVVGQATATVAVEL